MLLSIVTVSYNDADGLIETINSVKSQKLVSSLFEFLIIDGGSKDQTKTIVDANSDSVDLFVSEKDNGIYDAMNKGIKSSCGDWIIFMNAGDTFASDMVLDSFYSLTQESISEGNFIYGNYISEGVVRNQILSKFFLISHMINHQSIFYKKEFLSPGYDLRYKFCADYAHLIDNLYKVKPVKLKIPVACFDSTGVSSQFVNIYKMWLERLMGVIRSDLMFHDKVILSSRALVMLPLQYLRAKFILRCTK